MRVEHIDYIDKKKCKVDFGEDGYLPLYKSEVYKYNLEVGAEISEDTYKYVKECVVLKRGRERAMYILKNSDQTEKQLRDKLRRGIYPDDVIDDVVDFLKHHRYIDDEEYTRSFVRTYAEGKSLKAIKMKLAERGIEKEIYEDIIEEYYETECIDTNDIIYRYLEKKKYNSNMNVKEKNRVVSFLVRKGFEYQDIYDCLNNFNKKNSYSY